MPTPDPGGQTNAQVISRVRRMIRDQAVWFTDPATGDGTKGTLAAGSSPFRLKRAPVWTAGATPLCTVGGVNTPVVFDTAPAGGQVEIVSDTGELVFGTVPGNGLAILITYQAFRFGDQQILDALTDGMYELFPDIWQPNLDTSLIFSPPVTEYTLPAVFNNPNVTLMSVEMQPPNGILVSIPTGQWRRVGLTTLVITKPWPAGTIMRLTYNQPYLAISDMEVEVVQAACYFAAYRILMEQEAMRTRTNDLVALTGEGGAQPEQASRLAQLWKAQFDQFLKKRGRPAAYRTDIPGRSVEILEGGVGFNWNTLGG